MSLILKRQQTVSCLSTGFTEHLGKCLRVCFLSVPPGMPAAYDLSTVIGSGAAVSHNNLIPLGTNNMAAHSSVAHGSECSSEQVQHEAAERFCL